MFVERLNQKQVENLAKSLVGLYEEFKVNDFKFVISQDRRGEYWSVHITAKETYNEVYGIHFMLCDYGTIIRNTGLICEEVINKNSVKLMYQTFGEEYKKAYLDKAAEIFE